MSIRPPGASSTSAPLPNGIPSQASQPSQPAQLTQTSQLASHPNQRTLAAKYRGATVEDLDPPPALSVHPDTPISSAYLSAFERDFSHLTVTDPNTRALLGYLSIPRLKELLDQKQVADSDPVENAMQKFRRRGMTYQLITMETPLEELELFFEGRGGGGEKRDFAVVTDGSRRFVLGVATRGDLEEFVKRRPA